jgi:probable rRNA maturation factor
LFNVRENGIAALIILHKKIAGLSEPSLARFILRARRAAKLKERVNLLLTGDGEMRSLNFRFRRKNTATDVLSFPADFPRLGKRALAGEIAISVDIASDNATRFGHPADLEVKILALHGILHLAGFDHERDNGQMARKEVALRRKLGLPSSLTERGASNGQRPSHSGPRSKGTRRLA